MKKTRSGRLVFLSLLLSIMVPSIGENAHALLILEDGNDTGSLVGFGIQVLGGNRNSGVQYDLSSDSEAWLPDGNPMAGGQAVLVGTLISGTTLDLRCDTDTDLPEVWEDLQAATVSDIQDRDGDGHDDYARFTWDTLSGSTITAILDMDGSGGSFDRVVIPDPGTFWLLGSGLLGFAAARRRARRG